MVLVKPGSNLPAPPDGGWGWAVVFASFMIHVIADGVTYTFGIFYSEFLEYYGESKGTTAWVASIMVGMTYCIGPIASGLTNKYGCRAVTVAGAILAGVGLMLSTLAPNVLFLFFSVGLCTGAGFGLMYLPSIVSVSCYFEKRRAFATGIAVCGSGMGTFVLAPLTVSLIESYGWKGAMLIIAGLVFNCAVFGALFRPLEDPKPIRRSSIPRLHKLDLPKLRVCNSKMSSNVDITNPSTPLMFHVNEHPDAKQHQPDAISSDSKVANGFLCTSNDGKTVNGFISDAKISNGFISDAKISNGFINDAKISNGFISDTKISNGFISDAKISNGFISDAKISNGFISDAKVDGKSINETKAINGFITRSKSSDVSSRNYLAQAYSTQPSTPSETKVNAIGKDVVLRLNGTRNEFSFLRNSLVLPTDFLRRKLEGSQLSSFVCSSASLAQTNKELSQLESSGTVSHSGGLMYRKDIFYSGSTMNIAKYRSNPNISYSTVSSGDDDVSTKKLRFRCCPREIRDALLEMTDFSLLKDPIFLMFAVSNFLTSIGFNVPYIYTKDRVANMDMGVSEDAASFLLSIIGISNTVGRVTLGYLSDRSCVNRLWIYNTSLLICGLATALSSYAMDYVSMTTYCAAFGATAGAYVSLTSVILVDLLGLDKLTNAFGILLVFEGVACLIGPPITGWLYDCLGSYNPGFYASGSLIAVSGLMLFFVPFLNKPSIPDPEDPTLKLAQSSS